MLKPKYLWAITLLFILAGFLPFKIPVINPVLNTKNKLLVTPQACTCCGPFSIEKGELQIPTEYKKYFPKPVYEFSIPDDDDLSKTYNLQIESNYVIEAQVIGLDSSDGKTQGTDCSLRPLVKTTAWQPTNYYPIILYHGLGWFLFYIGVSFFMLIFSIIVTSLFLYKKRKLNS